MKAQDGPPTFGAALYARPEAAHRAPDASRPKVTIAGERPIFAAGAATASFIWFAALGYGARLLKRVFARPMAWRVLDAFVGIVMLTLAASLQLHALPA